MSRSLIPALLATLCAPALDCLAQCQPGWLPGPNPLALGGYPVTMTLWDPDGPGPLPVTHVVAGHIPTFSHIAVWNGNGWASIGDGVTAGSDTASYPISALAVMPDGSLVAAGSFTAAGGTPAASIARWDGQTWTPLATSITRPLFSLVGGVRALLVLPNGDLIAGGDFTEIDGVPARRIARFDGSTWHPLGPGITGPEAIPAQTAVFALALSPDGDIIAGGQFTHIGELAANNIARWDGAAWHALGSGQSGHVAALQYLPSGVLAAGGASVGFWDGTTWSIPGPGPTLPIRTLALNHAGQLLAAGPNHLFRWTGTSWAFDTTTDGEVRAIIPGAGSDLLIAGWFQTVDGAFSHRVARRVESAAPRIFAHPQPTTVSVGDTAVLTAIPELGFAERAFVTCRWQRNGHDVVPGPGGASPGGGIADPQPALLTMTWPVTLRIHNVRRSDAGEYTLTLTSACGETTTIPATLTVTCPADWNGDEDVNSSDISAFLVAWLTSLQDGSLTADINADGAITSADISAFLTAWLTATTTGC